VTKTLCAWAADSESRGIRMRFGLHPYCGMRAARPYVRVIRAKPLSNDTGRRYGEGLNIVVNGMSGHAVAGPSISMSEGDE